MLLTWQHKQFLKQNIMIFTTQANKIVVIAHVILHVEGLINLLICVRKTTNLLTMGKSKSMKHCSILSTSRRKRHIPTETSIGRVSAGLRESVTS